MAKGVGYKLKKGAAHSAGPISFGRALPGVYYEDTPTAAFDIGMDEADIDKVIKDRDLPLEKVKNATATRVEGQMVSGADVPPKSPEQKAEVAAAEAPPAEEPTSSGGEK